MRTTRILPLIALGLGLGCRSASSVPEPGAVLLQLGCADGIPAPDELRVWAYDDRGKLWDGARIPEQGVLDSSNPAKLGTILVAPGTIQGALRLHVRAFAAGVRLADGTLTVTSLIDGHRTHDLRLDSAVPADSDGDDVPDAIDDCVGVANPGQGGCAIASPADAGVPADGADHESDASNTIRDGAGSGNGKDLARTPNQDAGAEASVVADTKIRSGDGRDAPVDVPWVIKADAGPSVAIDGKPRVVVDGAGDRGGFVPDARVIVDPAANQDAGSDLRPDLAIPTDTKVAIDTTPTSPDALAGDTPEQDACGINCKKSQGELCSRDDECASTFCADGVCCSNACVGPCRSCNQPSATGLCQGYAADTDPESECLEGAKCNGVGACGTATSHDKANGQLCQSGTECLSGNCSDGVCCNELCNQPCQGCGTGTCLPVEKADDIPECTGATTCNAKGKCVAQGS